MENNQVHEKYEGEKKKILAVDDESSILDLLKFVSVPSLLITLTIIHKNPRFLNYLQLYK